MQSRILAIWFPQLLTDWMQRKQPALKAQAFALAMPERGRRVVKAISPVAQHHGLETGMTVADCQALLPQLQVFDHDAQQAEKLLYGLAEWCVRYSPLVGIDLPGGLVLDAAGCTHLWGGEQAYVQDIKTKLEAFGYSTRLAMADTWGAAWGLTRFAADESIAEPGAQQKALAALPPAALRPEPEAADKLHKLGLATIGHFINMPRTALRRRFGAPLLTRIDQALGNTPEYIEPIIPVPAYEERLPCLEAIHTAKGIAIAIERLLEALCQRMHREQKGLRNCELHCYRVDGLVKSVRIGTSKPSRNIRHLLNLFELHIERIEPGLGIELFLLKATCVEALDDSQDALWRLSGSGESALGELIDTVAGRIGVAAIHRYLPDEHYWPERAYREAASLAEKPATAWRSDLPRPLHLLTRPEPIVVTVPVPDYPPLLFSYKSVLHTVKKADGPERIEQEWWLQSGLYRDYYCIEDQHGGRYWIFRSGDLDHENRQWFLHGFFA